MIGTKTRIAYWVGGIIVCAAWAFAIATVIYAGPSGAPSSAPAALRDQWTATSRLYAKTEPNKYILDASVGPINYQAPWKGVSEWTEITPGWEAATAPWGWQTSGAEYDVRVKEDVTAAEVIEWEVDGSTVSFQPLNLQWSNALDQIDLISIPQSGASFVLTEKEAYWVGGYGAGRDLAWRLDNAALHKELLLQGASLPIPPQFIIDGGNPVLELNFQFQYSNDLDVWVDGAAWDAKSQVETANVVEFRRGAGELFSFRQPTATDAQGGKVVGLLRLKKQGPKLYLSVRIPRTWLQTAIFPVVVDPTLDLQVAAGADDGVSTDLGEYSNSSTTGAMGQSSGRVRSGWARFTGVSGLSGATIDVATSDLYHSTSGTPNLKIYADDQESPTAPTNQADHAGRARTTAGVDYDPPTDATAEWYTTPSIVGVIQELADSYDPSEIQLLIDNDGSSNATILVTFYDGDTALAPKLHIEYTAAGGGGARRILIIYSTAFLGLLSGLHPGSLGLTTLALLASLQSRYTATHSPVTRERS